MKTSFGQEYYGVDACMSNLMRPGMYDSYHHITIPDREGGMSILERAAAQEEGEGRAPRHVVGTLCENNDWFCKGRDLPTAQLGDLVVIHDTGTRTRSRDSRCAGGARRRAGGSHRQARAGMMKA
jgi:diaminopimelate decarboxylase